MYIVPLTGLEPVRSMTEPTAAPSAAQSAGIPFAQSLANAMKNLEQTQQVSQNDAYQLALGNTDDLHTMQINSIKSTAAVEMAVGATSRVLSAYNEVMRMQI